MRTMCSREIFTKKCQQQQIFDPDLKGAWHCNHVTFTPIAKNFMLYCRLIYMLSILCVRLTIKVKVRIPESFKVGWYPPKKKLGRVTLTKRNIHVEYFIEITRVRLTYQIDAKTNSCLNKAQSTFHVVLCFVYIYCIHNERSFCQPVILKISRVLK